MNTTLSKTIGNRINTLLGEKDIMQKELANHLEVTDNTISYFVSGKRIPNTEQIKKIAEYFNVSSDYLLGLTDEKTTDIELRAVCDYTKLSETSVKALHSKWGMSVWDIIDYLLGASGYNDFWSFCHEIRTYKTQFKELLDSQDSIMNDRDKAPECLEDLEIIISDYNSLQDSKDLSEFRLHKIFKSIIDSYCESEVKRELRNKPEFQKTYDYIVNDYMYEFLSVKDGDSHADNPKT